MHPIISRTNRRNALKTVMGAGALAFAPTAALSRDGAKPIFAEPFDLLLEFLPELNAVAGGHFAKHGLDVEIVNARGTSMAAQQLIAEKASFTKVGVLDLIKMQAQQKVPLLSVATIQQSPIFTVVSLKSAPVRGPEDMRGKTIGVASLGGGTENNLDLMLAAAGIPKGTVTRQAVGLSPGNAVLLKQGRIAAFFATIEGSIALERAKEPVEIWNIGRFAPIPGGAYVVTRDYAKKQADDVVKFMRGMRDSVNQLTTQSAAEILDRVQAKYEITGEKDRAFRLRAVAEYNALITGQGKENILRNVPDVWRRSADLIRKADIADVPAIDSLYTNEFLDAASR